MARLWLMIAAVFGSTGVIFGALGAHGLKSRLAPEALEVFHTATLYQLLHALALLALGVLALHVRQRLIHLAGGCFTLGILLFSGSLYVWVFTGFKPGIITPLGGVAFILGWLCLLLAAWRLEN